MPPDLHSLAGSVPAYWSIPFVLLLASIAGMPFVNKYFWERHYAYFSLGLGTFVALIYATQLDGYGTQKTLATALEYFKFIALIGSLFVVSGGILIEISGRGTPLDNIGVLAAGMLLANIVGTTGASVLLIRPFLRLNKDRLKPFHVVFFIFIVSNCAGALTPIGDPPLYLGYLNGVPFTWTLEHCWTPWLLANGLLLAIFFFLDRREALAAHVPDATVNKVIVRGRGSMFWLVVVLSAVFADPILERHVSANLARIPVGALLMSFAAFAAHRGANAHFLRHNGFSFGPIKEVALLFAGLFFCMMPALDYLEFHAAQLGLRTPGQFYFGSGTLSAFLDNAPAYLNFLSAAHGVKELALNPANVRAFAFDYPDFLKAVSLGSVFFGACTYIGNGPNLMVKAIADAAGARTPGFFEYIWKYTLPVLLPIYVLVWALFLR